MANIFQRIFKNLDFWDTDENKRQNSEMDREEEEERRRKREAERNSFNAPKAPLKTPSGVPVLGTTQKPSFNTGAAQSDSLFNPNQKPEKVVDNRNETQKELDRLTFDKMDEAVKEQEQGQNWFEKNLWGRSGNYDRAKVAARVKASTAYQEKTDPNFEREVSPELKAFNDSSLEMANAGSKKAQKTIADTKSAVDIMRLIPGAGLGELGANLVRGNFSGSREADDTLLREQFDISDAQIASLSRADRDKYLAFAKGGLSAGILDVAGLGAGSLIKGAGRKGVKEGVEVGLKESLKKATAKELGEDILSKQGMKTVATNIGVGTGAGAAIGAGGTAVLGGDEEDVLENAISGGITGAFGGAASSPFDAAVKLTKSNSKNAAKTSAQLVEASATESLDAIQKVTNRAAGKTETGGVSGVSDTPAATTPSVEVAPGVKSTNLAKETPDTQVPNPQGQEGTQPVPMQEWSDEYNGVDPRLNIPDPADPVALGRADENLVPDDQVMANFDEALDVVPERMPVEAVNDVVPEVQPTQTEIAQDAAAGVLPQQLDEAGNPMVQTDAQAAQALEDAGVAPVRGDSVVDTEEQQLADAAAEATQREVNLDDTSAPLVRERLLNRIDDDEVAEDLAANAPRKETINLEDAKVAGTTKVREWDDNQLIDQFEGGRKVDGPESFYTNVAALSRLEKISREGLDEASLKKLNEAQRNAFESIADYAEESGRGLRTVQVLFEDMPKTMKVEYLMKKLNHALPDEADAIRMELTTKIDSADAAIDTLRTLETSAQKQLDAIETGAFQSTPENVKAMKQLAEDVKVAQRNKELRAGEAYKFWKSKMPKGNVGKNLGQWGRTLMLSSPGGRAFDLISTAATFFDDLTTQGVSAVIGKAFNAGKGNGAVIDTGPNARQVASGAAEGFRDTFGKEGSLRGSDRVEDFMGEAKRATRGETGDLTNPIASTIRAFVELPTNLTRGMYNTKLYSQGVQEAKRLGIDGPDTELYGMLRAVVPSKKQMEVAKDAHLRVNMLHENGISRGLNRVAASLDNSGKTSWMTPIVRNQIAPFTSWLGGNLNRTLTDKNIAYNAFDAVRSFARGEDQAGVDALAKLAVNGGQAFAVGTLLTQAGILTDQNETADEGDDYAGLYFHIGDRYIPVGILGTAAVPIILGNATSQAMQSAEENGDGFVDSVLQVAGNTLVNTGKNTGVASVFGGENNLQKTVSDMFTDNGGTVQDEVFNPLIKAGGNILRQYIPAGLGDVNALLDNSPFNPTGEAALTKATYENPETGREKTDVPTTELNKTLAKIPFLSQGLDRDEGKASKDSLDKILKSSKGTATQEEEKEKTLTDAQKKKQREEDDIPDTDEAIKARVENDELDGAIAGFKQQYDDIKDDEDVPKSKKEAKQVEIKRLEIARDNGYGSADIALYSKTGLEEWRKLADPDSSEYNKELADRLYTYDKKLAEAGASRDDDDPKNPKYYQKGDGSKRGGSGSGGKAKFSTDIAKNTINFDDFTPIKAQAATMKEPKSSIPEIAKTPNYSRKPKKISVSKGGRA